MNVQEHIEYKTDEIIRNGQSKGRTRDLIMAHVTSGFLCEKYVAETLGLEFNSMQNHDVSNPHTFAYDLVSKDGKTFEVKSLQDNNSSKGWLNVNKYKDKIPGVSYGPYPDIATTHKYLDYVDYIIFVSSNPYEIKYIFDANEFFRKLKQSSRNVSSGNSTHYLNPNSLINFKGKL